MAAAFIIVSPVLCTGVPTRREIVAGAVKWKVKPGQGVLLLETGISRPSRISFTMGFKFIEASSCSF